MALSAAVLPVTEHFDALSIPYFITGSVAAGAWGMPRSTADVDLVAAIAIDDAASFARALQDTYYVDLSSIVDAIAHASSFNLTHHATNINLDVFVATGGPWVQKQFTRARDVMLPGSDVAVRILSPEDLVLGKLLWFEQGNRVSDQQWRDIQGLLRVQAGRLDLQYLRRWAADQDVGALLETALRGERPEPPGAAPRQERLI